MGIRIPNRKGKIIGKIGIIIGKIGIIIGKIGIIIGKIGHIIQISSPETRIGEIIGKRTMVQEIKVEVIILNLETIPIINITTILIKSSRETRTGQVSGPQLDL